MEYGCLAVEYGCLAMAYRRFFLFHQILYTYRLPIPPIPMTSVVENLLLSIFEQPKAEKNISFSTTRVDCFCKAFKCRFVKFQKLYKKRSFLEGYTDFTSLVNLNCSHVQLLEINLSILGTKLKLCFQKLRLSFYFSPFPLLIS